MFIKYQIDTVFKSNPDISTAVQSILTQFMMFWLSSELLSVLHIVLCSDIREKNKCKQTDQCHGNN